MTVINTRLTRRDQRKVRTCAKGLHTFTGSQCLECKREYDKRTRRERRKRLAETAKAEKAGKKRKPYVPDPNDKHVRLFREEAARRGIQLRRAS